MNLNECDKCQSQNIDVMKRYYYEQTNMEGVLAYCHDCGKLMLRYWERKGRGNQGEPIGVRAGTGATTGIKLMAAPPPTRFNPDSWAVKQLSL